MNTMGDFRRAPYLLDGFSTIKVIAGHENLIYFHIYFHISGKLWFTNTIEENNMHWGFSAYCKIVGYAVVKARNQ